MCARKCNLFIWLYRMGQSNPSNPSNQSKRNRMSAQPDDALQGAGPAMTVSVSVIATFEW